MGQSDILELLEKAQLPMTGRQIAEALNDDLKKTFHALRRLLDFDEIKCIHIDWDEDINKAFRYFNSKSRIRLYYHPEKKINKKDIKNLFERLEAVVNTDSIENARIKE